MLCAYENIHIVYAQYKFHIYYYYYYNWIKSCILIGLRSEVFSVELRVENEAKWYCFA